MDYGEALRYLEGLSRFGCRPGLARMRCLLTALGHPEAELPVVHVAGTNGKGSTAAMVASVLAAAGYRVGLYTSPHLQNYTERIRLNGRPIPPARLAALVGRLAEVVADCVAAGLDHPTEFEVGTAVMYTYFAEEGVDVLVQETGLGGRLDATNVVQKPLVAVITPIGLDHTDRLGGTLAAIAREKAGIIKQGRPVVSAPQEPEAAAVVASVARRLGCRLFQVGTDVAYRPRGLTLERGEMDYRGWVASYEGLSIGLGGAHQLTNAACALAALELLRAEGFRLPEEAVRRGLAEVRWPGRLEVVRREPLVLLDGAHNPAGARALGRALSTLLSGRKVILVWGMLADKDAASALAETASLAQVVIATRPDSPRALPAEELARLVPEGEGGGKEVRVVPDPLAAVDLALGLAGPRDVICVAGSLYLVGQVRGYLAPGR